MCVSASYIVKVLILKSFVIIDFIKMKGNVFISTSKGLKEFFYRLNKKVVTKLRKI